MADPTSSMNIPPKASAGLRLRWVTLIFLAWLPCASCDNAPQATENRETAPKEQAPAAPATIERDILDVINAVTPLAPTAPAAEKSAWYGRRLDTLERMREAGHAHGLEALRVFGERSKSLPEIRKGLLDIAAHNAPEESSPLLESLVDTYGENLGLRSYAAELMGSATPELAIKVLEPILLGQRPGKTYPQLDLILGSWNLACITLERDRIPVICEVAIDPGQRSVARHAATKLLGTMESDQGRQALERILIETGTDGMIRRFAAQSLVKTTTPEVLCAIIERTLAREQDQGFQAFLANLSFKYCR